MAILFVMLLLVFPSSKGLKIPISPLKSVSTQALVSSSFLRANHIMTHLSTSSYRGGQFSLSSLHGAYSMEMSMGTPPQKFSRVLVDTASDLTWISCLNYSSPRFEPQASTSLSKIPCEGVICESMQYHQCSLDQSCTYEYDYSQGGTLGQLFMDTLTLTSTQSDRPYQFPDVVAGCAFYDRRQMLTSRMDGVIGLGRGPLSLSTQLRSSGGNKFSYCLSKDNSTLFFGDDAYIRNQDAAQYIEFVKQENVSETFYFIQLTGITVGDSTLQITQNMMNPMVIDSGTTLTFLPYRIYSNVMSVLYLMLQESPYSYSGLELCYRNVTTASFPTIELHFSNATMIVPPESYMVNDRDNGLVCVAIAPAEEFAILGNVMQQNMQILYDGEGSSLSFAPTTCSSL